MNKIDHTSIWAATEWVAGAMFASMPKGAPDLPLVDGLALSLTRGLMLRHLTIVVDAVAESDTEMTTRLSDAGTKLGAKAVQEQWTAWVLAESAWSDVEHITRIDGGPSVRGSLHYHLDRSKEVVRFDVSGLVDQ